MRYPAVSKLSLLLVCLTALACRSAPIPHYYLLNAYADAPSTASVALAEDTVVGVGPIDFPTYLNRPQLVLRRGGVEVELLEMHRWAEPLERHFTTTLSELVSERTGSDRVLVFPWSTGERIERRVMGEVSRFDVDETGRALLVVRWQVRDGEGQVLVPSRQSRFTETASPGEPAAMVEALTATVAAFSGEVAAALSGLSGDGP